MDQVFYAQATNAKCNEIVDLRDWIGEVKQLDDEKRFERLQAIKDFEQSAAVNRAASRTNNTSQNIAQGSGLNGSSHKVNTAAAPASSTTKMDYPPKLTEEEKSLLLKYDGCLKCHKPFVNHKGSDKVAGCNSPVGSSYKPVTFTMITSAMPNGYKAKVSAIIPANTGLTFSGHPVAAVFPGVSHPVDYAAPNTSNVLGDLDDPDSSVSTILIPSAVSAVTTIIDNVDAAISVAIDSIDDATAPLSVPHMFWRATAAAASLADSEPIKFDCLIDNSSHLVLIRNALTKDLSLCRHTLPEPIETEVPM
jgi:hypothetical protein